MDQTLYMFTSDLSSMSNRYYLITPIIIAFDYSRDFKITQIKKISYDDSQYETRVLFPDLIVLSRARF